MKPYQLARRLQIGRSTITLWTSNPLFIPFLSDDGRGGRGGLPREFNEHDAAVMNFIVQMKRANWTEVNIAKALEQHKADSWQQLPPAPKTEGEAMFPVVPQATMQLALLTERQAFEQQIEFYRAESERQRALVEAAGANAERLLRELGDMQARLAKAEALLELYDSGRLKPGGRG